MNLYNKYRPIRFNEVVGQDSVISIINNQINQEKHSHAYIFTGTRGTGKTSSARIFAKAITCLSPMNGEPCWECESCRGQSVDIIEMDGATNNGVDDMRSLITGLKYRPVELKYKIVIIDEVHMLSNSAFNSLLLTLEEPPEHVVFILSTTELNKIPATVRSRCQIFLFNRISTVDMIAQLKYVCKMEHIEAEEAALELIASNADGALRDALSILDQLSAAGTITKELVQNKLGIVQSTVLFQTLNFIFSQNSLMAIKTLRSISGFNLREIIRQILEILRDIIIFKSSGSFLDDRQDYQKAIRQFNISIIQLNNIYHHMYELYNKMGQTLNQNDMEFEIIKLCNPVLRQDMSSLIERIEKLESIQLDFHSSEDEAKMEIVSENESVPDDIEFDEGFKDEFNDEFSTAFDSEFDLGFEEFTSELEDLKNSILDEIEDSITIKILSESNLYIEENILIIEVKIPTYQTVLKHYSKQFLMTLNIDYKIIFIP